MDEKRYQELEKIYGNMLDGPDNPEHRAFMSERMRRKYEEVMKKQAEQQAKQKPAG